MDHCRGIGRRIFLSRRYRRPAAVPDTLTRLHALTKADNLGLGLVVLGLLPHVSGPLAALKLVCVWLLVLLAGATASQLIARVARRAEPPA